MPGLKQRLRETAELFGDQVVTVALHARSLGEEGDPDLTPRPGTGVRDVLFTPTHLANWAIAVGARNATNAAQNVRLLGGLPRGMLQDTGLSDEGWRALEAERRKVPPTEGWRIGDITLGPTAGTTIVGFMNALMGPEREKLLPKAPLFNVRFETWGRGPEDYCRATIRFPGPSDQILECSYAWPSQQGRDDVFSGPDVARRARTAIARSFDLSGDLLSALTDLLINDEAKRNPEARPGTAKASGLSGDQFSGTKRAQHTTADRRDVEHLDIIRMCVCVQPPSSADLVVSPTAMTGDDNERRYAAHAS